MSVEASTATIATNQEQGWIAQKLEMTRHTALRSAAIGGVLLAGLGAAYAVGRSGSSPEGAPAASAADVSSDPNCNDLQLGNVASSYGVGKFLPAAPNGVNNANQAASYTKSLFDKNGPL